MKKAAAFSFALALIVSGCGETATGDGGAGGTAGSGGNAGASGMGGTPPPPPPPAVDQTCREWCANEPEGPSCHQGPFESVQPCYEDCLSDYQREVERQCSDEWIAIKDCQVDLDCEDLFGDCDSVEALFNECVQRVNNRDYCETNCPEFDIAQCEEDTTECGQFAAANNYCELRCPTQDREQCIAQHIVAGACDYQEATGFCRSYCSSQDLGQCIEQWLATGRCEINDAFTACLQYCPPIGSASSECADYWDATGMCPDPGTCGTGGAGGGAGGAGGAAPKGACDNGTDLCVIEGASVRNIARDCGVFVCAASIGNSNAYGQCVDDCVNARAPGISPDCANCYGNLERCGLVALCRFPCQANTCSALCLDCLNDASCITEFEQCRGIPGDGCADTGMTEWRIFRTATVQNANLGGIAGADAICVAQALAAGLDGEFKAWLSTISSPVSDRVTHATGPYVLVDGTIVANDWDDLVDGSILAPVSIDASGMVRAGEVWTGTLATGASYPSDDCAAFTSGTTGVALCGATNSTTATWTENITPACSTQLGLYCIEQ